MHTEDQFIYQQPVEILQNLIRFDTTNPPGNVRACIQYIKGLLDEVGIESQVYALTPEKPNLFARIPGAGECSPLMLYGHVDVVTTAGQDWRYPPFEGRIVDDYVWGRGALDMKGGVAMMLAAVMRAKSEAVHLPGDVILCLNNDEETMGEYGARYMVESHPELFNGVRYALSEFGGFSFYIGGKCLYPIMIAEKQVCWLTAKFRGPGGHGSMPIQGGAMSKMARVIRILDVNRLPVHITDPTRMMFEGIANTQTGLTRLILGLSLKPVFTNRVLDLLGERGKAFDPLFHNTVSPNIVRGGEKINVIPSQISLELDGRLLPGFQPQTMLDEIHELVGHDIELEVKAHDPGPQISDMEWFDTLSDILQTADPSGKAVPLVLPAVTDARLYAKLGIQTYGFTPMQLPEGFSFNNTAHGADERIPVEALTFGSNAIFKAMLQPRP